MHTRVEWRINIWADLILGNSFSIQKMDRLSRTIPLVAIQGFLNVFLAFWLYMEYVHNRFLREYLAGFWTANYPVVVVLLASGGVGIGSLLYLARRREFVAERNAGKPMKAAEGLSPGLVPLDACPFCNAPLRILSEDRFQCRRCGRYFKK